MGNPPKRQWIKRIRTLRRLLKKYRLKKKINKNMYYELYLKAKGNTFRNKRVLIEHITREKAERKRSATLAAQMDARRNRVKRDRLASKKLVGREGQVVNLKLVPAKKDKKADKKAEKKVKGKK